MIKTFETYKKEQFPKIWITGIPSGECFEVDYAKIEDLYKAKLVYYDSSKLKRGILAFKDKDREKFLELVGIKEEKAKHDFMIFDNRFKPALIKIAKNIVEECPFYVEMYVNNEFMGFSFKDMYFEIEITGQRQTKLYGESNSYEIVKTYKGKTFDKYKVSSDKLLIKRIHTELNSEVKEQD